MSDTDLHRVASAVIGRSLDGASETELLRRRSASSAGASGSPLSRAMALVDTLHPVYEGRAFRWRNDGVEETAVIEYGPTSAGPMPPTTGSAALLSPVHDRHRRAAAPARARRARRLLDVETLRAEGETDYIAFAQPLRQRRRDRRARLRLLAVDDAPRPRASPTTRSRRCRRLVPALALAIKCASLARIAGTLVEVYLGRDAGQRVLAGRIARGVADRINAVLWFSDLRGYTSITDTAAARRDHPAPERLRRRGHRGDPRARAARC